METQSKPDWRAIAVFYFLACLWSWPFFWWRDVNTASWNAWHLPEEIKGLTQPWGPALAAMAVFYLFPRSRSRSASLLGSSWKRSALCFVTPIFFACVAYAIQIEAFLLSARQLPADRRLLHLRRGTRLARIPARRAATPGPASRLSASGVPVGNLALYLAYERYLAPGDFPIGNNRSRHRSHHLRPAFLTERTGSILLATAVHEWIDLGVDTGGYLLWAGRPRRRPGVALDCLDMAGTQLRTDSTFHRIVRA
jgi:hypothetical protein